MKAYTRTYTPKYYMIKPFSYTKRSPKNITVTVRKPILKSLDLAKFHAWMNGTTF